MAAKKYPTDFRLTGNGAMPVSFLMPGFSQFAPGASNSPSVSSLPAVFNMSPSDRAAASLGLSGLFASSGINAPASAIVSGLSGDSTGLAKGATSWATGNALASMGLGKAAGPLAGIAGNLVVGDKAGAFDSGITGTLAALGGVPGALLGLALSKTGAIDYLYKNLFNLDKYDNPLADGEYAFDDAAGSVPGGDANALVYGDQPSYDFVIPDLGGSFGSSTDFGGSGVTFGDLGGIDWSLPSGGSYTGGDFGYGDNSSWSGNMLGGLDGFSAPSYSGGDFGSFSAPSFSGSDFSMSSGTGGDFGGGWGSFGGGGGYW